MQLRQFEEEVGLPPFEKLGKQVSLTEAGREIFQYCRSINRSLFERRLGANGGA
jgi:DNA-binding transcriptional LysR family regulator